MVQTSPTYSRKAAPRHFPRNLGGADKPKDRLLEGLDLGGIGERLVIMIGQVEDVFGPAAYG